MLRIFLTGASSGIGRTTLDLLARNDFEIWAVSRKPETLPARSNIHPVQLDLNDLAAVEETFLKLSREVKGFDVLINNAGYASYGPTHLMEAEAWTAQMRVMFTAPLLLTQLALREMPQGQDLRILNITSLAVRFPIPFMGPYGAAKSALSAATQALRLEWGNQSPFIVEIQPGDINTPFHEAMQIAPPTENPLAKPCRTAYLRIEQEMKSAPSPELVAGVILRAASMKNPPALLTAGGFFQTKLAPLALRFFPHSWLNRLIARHYGL